MHVTEDEERSEERRRRAARRGDVQEKQEPHTKDVGNEGNPGAKLSGQLPHSHIGELKCMQNTRENIPSVLNVCKIRRKS